VICSGSSTNLSATGAGGTGPYNYLWQPGGLPGNAPAITPAVTTTYTVTVTDANGCTNTATELIVVNPVPVVALSGLPLSGCAPLTVVFTDNSTVTPPAVVTSWLWDFGDGNTSTAQSPTHQYLNAGSYNVILTITSTGGCTATLTLNNYVNVDPHPVAGFSASPQPTNILEATITFTDQSTGATSWQWNFGDVGNSTSTLQNPIFLFPDTGCYMVQQVVTDANSCTDTATSLVCIDPDWAIYVPNAFTPNADGINDVFMPVGVGIEETHYDFWIFDRWGNLIFYTDDLHKGWDGKVKGGAEIAQIDTYVWKLRCRDVLGGAHKYIGKVSLIK
jgi:gliding motility-associated-like protein